MREAEGTQGGEAESYNIIEEHVNVSDSTFWKNWRQSKVYSAQVKVFSGDILMNAKCDLKPAQLDPYVVVYLAKDRENSKKKTHVLKRTSNPVWNESLRFDQLDYSETLCVEVKIPAFSITNPLLGHVSFTVKDLLSTSLGDLNGYTYTLISDMPGVEVSLYLGFKFDTPLVGVEAANDINTAVFLNSHEAFASFAFFPCAAKRNEKIALPKVCSDDEVEYIES